MTVTHLHCAYVDLYLKSLSLERQAEIQTLVLNFMQVTVYLKVAPVDSDSEEMLKIFRFWCKKKGLLCHFGSDMLLL